MKIFNVLKIYFLMVAFVFVSCEKNANTDQIDEVIVEAYLIESQSTIKVRLSKAAQYVGTEINPLSVPEIS